MAPGCFSLPGLKSEGLTDTQGGWEDNNQNNPPPPHTSKKTTTKKHPSPWCSDIPWCKYLFSFGEIYEAHQPLANLLSWKGLCNLSFHYSYNLWVSAVTWPNIMSYYMKNQTKVSNNEVNKMEQPHMMSSREPLMTLRLLPRAPENAF